MSKQFRPGELQDAIMQTRVVRSGYDFRPWQVLEELSGRTTRDSLRSSFLALIDRGLLEHVRHSIYRRTSHVDRLVLVDAADDLYAALFMVRKNLFEGGDAFFAEFTEEEAEQIKSALDKARGRK